MNKNIIFYILLALTLCLFARLNVIHHTNVPFFDNLDHVHGSIVALNDIFIMNIILYILGVIWSVINLKSWKMLSITLILSVVIWIVLYLYSGVFDNNAPLLDIITVMIYSTIVGSIYYYMLILAKYAFTYKKLRS